LLSQSLRDPAGTDLGMPEPGPEDADWIIRPPRRALRQMDRVRHRIPGGVRRVGSDVAALGIFVLLAVWVAVHLWLGPQRVSPLRPSQQSATEELLGHMAHALRHLENPFLGLPAGVPGGGVAVALPLAPVTLWLGPGFAYTLWLTLALAGSAATAYWALRRYLVGSRVAAFLGAFVFGFAPGILWHANGQPAYVTNLLIPVIVVLAVRLGHGRPIRDGVLLGLLLGIQVLINGELLAITALAGGVAALCYRVQRPGTDPGGWRRIWPPRWPGTESGRARLAGLAVAAGTALVLLAYPVWHQPPFAVPDPTLGEDPSTYALYWRDTLGGSFTADRSIGGIEQNTWFGWPLLILAGVCVTLIWARSVAVRVATLTALVFGVVGLGAQIRLNGAPTPVPGPWWLLGKIPGLDLIAPTHLALVLVPCLAILLAEAYEHMPTGEPVVYGLTLRRLWILLFAIALIPVLPRPVTADAGLGTVPAFIASGEWRGHLSAGQTVLPVPSGTDSTNPVLLRAAALDEFDVPVAYLEGGTATTRLLQPVWTSGSVPVLSDDMTGAVLDELRDWHVGLVVVVPGGKREQSVRETLTNLLGREPVKIGGAWVWDVRQSTSGG